LKGKKAKVSGIEFCEGIWFKVKEKKEGIGKLAVRWKDGVYLGVRAASGELIVGTAEGVFRSRTVKRKPFESRWLQENANMIGGVPWKVSEEDDGDGPARKGVIKLDAKVMGKDEEEAVRTSPPVVPKSFTITQKDLIEHGFTDGCMGCRARLRGTERQKHSDLCRQRLVKEMKGDAKVKEATKRENEFMAEVLEESMRKKKRINSEKAGEEQAETPGSSSSSSTLPRGAKRGAEVTGQDVEYDEEGTRINKVEMETNVEVQDEEMIMKAFDDVSGEGLDPRKVSASRSEEIDFMRTRGIWEVVPISMSWSLTGVGPTSVKWVDTMKRSRLVARDFKPKGEEERADIFASMPPWEAKKLLFSKAASQKGMSRKRKLSFIDATKAHVNGVCDVDAFIDLPEEIREPGKCAKLKFWLYGMRPAARASEDTYAFKLVELGFVQGVSAPTVFFHREKCMECVVHGDDFTILGFEEDLDELEVAMRSWFEIKVRGRIGPDSSDAKEITILNRTVTWLDWGIRIVADPKHAERLTEFFGLEATSTSVVSFGKKEKDLKAEAEGVENDDEVLGGKEASIYRGLAATANYLSQDRFDIQFGSKELCRDMAHPTTGSMGRMKRGARYLLGVPTLEIEYVEQYPPAA